jgi:hypothetical protein
MNRKIYKAIRAYHVTLVVGALSLFLVLMVVRFTAGLHAATNLALIAALPTVMASVLVQAHTGVRNVVIGVAIASMSSGIWAEQAHTSRCFMAILIPLLVVPFVGLGRPGLRVPFVGRGALL